MKKIIVGTPRSGTSFVARWYANSFPKHTALDEERLYEHFENSEKIGINKLGAFRYAGREI